MKYGNWDRLGVANDGADVLIEVAGKTMRLPHAQAGLFARNLQGAIQKARANDPAFIQNIMEQING